MSNCQQCHAGYNCQGSSLGFCYGLEWYVILLLPPTHKPRTTFSLVDFRNMFWLFNFILNSDVPCMWISFNSSSFVTEWTFRICFHIKSDIVCLLKYYVWSLKFLTLQYLKNILHPEIRILIRAVLLFCNPHPLIRISALFFIVAVYNQHF